MKRKPIIGITSYGRNDEKLFTLPAAYVDSVRRAGGIAILIPPGEPDLADLLGLIDGLILSGGGDIDPDLYQGQHHPAVYRIDAERDQSELALSRLIVARQTPTLCICRGTQVLNVALGGSLIEHLPDEVGERLTHRSPLDPKTNRPYGDPARHAVTVQADSDLGQILAQSEVVPVSWHHQAIRRVADGLKVVAQADDGTIEAVEMPDHPWLIGVQWHPEMSAAEDPSQQRIFDAFVQAVVDLTQERAR